MLNLISQADRVRLIGLIKSHASWFALPIIGFVASIVLVISNNAHVTDAVSGCSFYANEKAEAYALAGVLGFAAVLVILATSLVLVPGLRRNVLKIFLFILLQLAIVAGTSFLWFVACIGLFWCF
jgi:hypothetical protein